MKYTDEQRAILALSRKYKGVKTIASKDGSDNDCVSIEVGDEYEIVYSLGSAEAFLEKYATPKQVGRPKGSTKPSRKVKRDISLSADQWSKVEEIRTQQGLKYASHAIGLAVEAFTETDEAYKKGYSDGYSEGYNQGYEDC